jgi:hypothetical protein
MHYILVTAVYRSICMVQAFEITNFITITIVVNLYGCNHHLYRQNHTQPLLEILLLIPI